jgi:hypothetical protein
MRIIVWTPGYFEKRFRGDAESTRSEAWNPRPPFPSIDAR